MPLKLAYYIDDFLTVYFFSLPILTYKCIKNGLVLFRRSRHLLVYSVFFFFSPDQISYKSPYIFASVFQCTNLKVKITLRPSSRHVMSLSKKFDVSVNYFSFGKDIKSSNLKEISNLENIWLR